MFACFFMCLSGYILIVQRPAQSTGLWHFFGPFQTALWIAVLVEIVAVALLCYLMESPFLSSIKDSDVVGENSRFHFDQVVYLSLLVISLLSDGGFEGFVDSLYWSFTLLLQNPDKAPRTWGGKLVMMAHGWFMLIIVASCTRSSYLIESMTLNYTDTANLASFLTASFSVPGISDWSSVLNR